MDIIVKYFEFTLLKIGAKNRPTPKKFATPTLKLEEKTADEELGEDLMDIQSPSYGLKSSKRSQSSMTYKRKEGNTYVSPSRRSAQNTIQHTTNYKAKLPKSPSKDFASKRVEKLQDPSLSVSSSSEEDDKTDEDWRETERGPKRQKVSIPNGNNAGVKNSTKLLPKVSRQVRGCSKTSPRKMCDINKSVISDREYSNHSSNDEFDSTPRPAKGKGGKSNSASGTDKKQILGTLFRSQAKIQPKKDTHSSNSSEKTSKSNENRTYDSSAETKAPKEEHYNGITVPNDSHDIARLCYRSTNEHGEMRRPIVPCRIPLASIKSASENLNAIFELRRSANVKQSKKSDSLSDIVTTYNKQSNQQKDRSDISANPLRGSSSERSSKKKRDRSRRDSSASSNVSLKSSKHVRKKRSQRHTNQGFSDSSSDSDHGGSVHSSTGSSYNKRKRKDPMTNDIETQSKSTPENPTSNLQSAEPRSTSSLSHSERIKALEVDHPPATNLSPNATKMAGIHHSEEQKGASSYHDVQYYGYNEDNQESEIHNSNRSPSSVGHPIPSTSNGIKDTQSHQSRMMPPPNNKMFYSYVEQRRAEEEQPDDTEVDPTDYMVRGKGLKHEADKEPDRERQAMKYLQAVLHFILYAHANEQRNEKQGAFTIYQETLNLVK